MRSLPSQYSLDDMCVIVVVQLQQNEQLHSAPNIPLQLLQLHMQNLQLIAIKYNYQLPLQKQ